MGKHQNFKTVDGARLRKEEFAYAPGNDPEEWKLPIDARHVRAAMEMFARTELPAAAKKEAAARIARAAAEHGVDEREIARFRTRHLSEGAIPVLLSGLGVAAATPPGASLHRPGAQLRELKVAVTGSWVKDLPFSITPADLASMAANFDKRKNDMVVIDYEHASETPEVAKGGPVPAAGWIHALRTERNGTDALVALVEWTPEAEQMIHNGEYRFFSPAIDWGATDKDTGKLQGATLTSGALTNHPFLEELPPIMLRDGRIVTAAANLPSAEGHLSAFQNKGVYSMKNLSLKPIPEGEEQAGNHAVFDEESKEPLGFISHPVLAHYAAEHLGLNPDAREDSETSLEDDGDEAAAQALKVEARAAHRRNVLLREAVRHGRIDCAQAAALAESGRISLAEFIHAQEAEKLVDSAVAEGKILPRDRAFFFRDAMERPEEFREYVRGAAPAVRLGARGIGSGEALPVDEEVHLGASRLMDEKGLDYAKALKAFLSSNPALGEQYRARHSSRVSADGIGK
ncbi:MAG: hypothetical protein KGM47_09870 [Acidobacteriota bacterium]|nr:hypothetical protein [Acidobacteriota bacterium]